MHCYPISSGRNWGYGGASPVLNDALIVDFNKMNNIRHFDDVNGVVDIEPGVTQGQLAHYLKDALRKEPHARGPVHPIDE